MARVVKAFSKFAKERRRKDGNSQLVIVGSKEFAHGRFFNSMVESGLLESEVVLPGYVDQKDLNVLYSSAEAFLFPSLYEGFGIPVLEAMACGTPVLTSHSSSLPEVAGEAAYYVNPSEEDAITEGMKALADDPGLRQELIKKGFERIKRFSWRQTALQTLEVYASLSG